eukprot:c18326_g1_i4.p1 GENE.c18326_g1_i4~~c18326_g1_i4.p1  ORF type:complete len:740 (+),score=162.29 c18326_g1_i4:41-2260(+)
MDEVLCVRADSVLPPAPQAVYSRSQSNTLLIVFSISIIPLILSLVAAYTVLRPARFNLERVWTVISIRSNPPTMSPTLKHYLAHTTILLPIVFLLLIGGLVGALIKFDLVVLAIVIIGVAYLCLALALLRWAHNKWEFSVQIGQLLFVFTVLTFLFEVFATLWIKPVSFLSVSALFLSLNGMCIVSIAYARASILEPDFPRWALVMLRRDRVTNSELQTSHLKQDATEIHEFCQYMYIGSLGLIVCYVVVTLLVVDGPTQSHCLAIAWTIFVTDYVYLTLVAWLKIPPLEFSLHAVASRILVVAFSYQDFGYAVCVAPVEGVEECCAKWVTFTNAYWFTGMSLVYFMLGALILRYAISSMISAPKPTPPALTEAIAEQGEGSIASAPQQTPSRTPTAKAWYLLCSLYAAYLGLVLIYDLANLSATEVPESAFFCANVGALACYGLALRAIYNFERDRCEMSFAVQEALVFMLVLSFVTSILVFAGSSSWLCLWIALFAPLILTLLTLTHMCWVELHYPAWPLHHILSADHHKAAVTKNLLVFVLWTLLLFCLMCSLLRPTLLALSVAIGVFLMICTYLSFVRLRADNYRLTVPCFVLVLVGSVAGLALSLVALTTHPHHTAFELFFFWGVGLHYPAVWTFLILVAILASNDWNMRSDIRMLLAGSVGLAVVYIVLVSVIVRPWVVGGALAYGWAMALIGITYRTRAGGAWGSLVLVPMVVLLPLITIFSGHRRGFTRCV